jgi:16S rRNA (cytidine1402-2'-O)-methyltransferase
VNTPSSFNLLNAALSLAGTQEYPVSALYVVATPIGNLADISLRAVHVLYKADTIACEDTRHSGHLLHHLGIHKPLLAAHEHNERQAAEAVIERLTRGERVAYVSDAGTPAISDPGAQLVARVRAAGFRTIPIPGASSLITALSVAGVEVLGPFRFLGFLPASARERDRVLTDCARSSDTQVIFEAPHRIRNTCSALAALCPERTISVCRELTKQFESVNTLLAGEIPAWIEAQAQGSRGEFVLVLHAMPPSHGPKMEGFHEETLRILLRNLPLKQAVSLTAEITGAPRNTLYARALEYSRGS